MLYTDIIGVEFDLIDGIFDKIDGIAMSEVRFPVAGDHSFVSRE